MIFFHIISLTDENSVFDNREIEDGLGSCLPQDNLGISPLEVIVCLIPLTQIQHALIYTQF